MSSVAISCSAYVDYSSRKNCPMYNLNGCQTPEAPILCPMIENLPRSPCTRFICSSDIEADSSIPTSTTTSTTITNAVSGIVNGMIGVSQDVPNSNFQRQVYLFIFLGGKRVVAKVNKLGASFKICISC